MDDTAQKQNQTNDNAQTQPQIIPVGTVNKEIETGAVSDYITPSEPEIIREKEVKEAGVKEVSETPSLTEEQQRMGIKPAAEVTPVPSQPSENIKLPLTEEQAKQVSKQNSNIKDSIVWLAVLMLKHFKKVHRKLFRRGD